MSLKSLTIIVALGMCGLLNNCVTVLYGVVMGM